MQEVEDKGELLVTMVGPTPVGLQRRVPASGKFSATFKAGAKFQKCDLTDDAWAGMRSILADVTTPHRPTTLMEAAGCHPGAVPVAIFLLLTCVSHTLPIGTISCINLFTAENDHILYLADTPLPILWTVELLPDSSIDAGFCAGEFDLGCIGISTSLHLAETVADAAIGTASVAKKKRLEKNGDEGSA